MTCAHIIKRKLILLSAQACSHCSNTSATEPIVCWRNIPIALKMPGVGILSAIAWFRQLGQRRRFAVTIHLQVNFKGR